MKYKPKLPLLCNKKPKHPFYKLKNIPLRPVMHQNTLFARLAVIGLLLVLLITSCDPYQKLLKSTNYDLKYAKAKEYYNKGNYSQASPLLEELMTVWRGSRDVEKIYYFYAYCYYGSGDYLLSANYFKNFTNYYPKSAYAEDALYMSGYSFYKMSPKPSLDATDTRKAIDALQLFINTYPSSTKVTACNDLIDELRGKLETKAFEGAYLYYRMRNYKAASTSLKAILRDYPDTPKREEVMFLIVKSYYLLAQNSIESKRKERYQAASEAYIEFIDKFPQSEYRREAERLYSSALEFVKTIDQKQKATSNE